MILQAFLLIIGVFTCATAVIMIKASTEHVLLLAAYRQIAAALILSPLFYRAYNEAAGSFRLSDTKQSILPAVFLGLHFITWNIGARMTLAANASLIVNMIPVVMPFFMFFLMKEVINRREIIGTLITGIGLYILARSDFHISRESFLGDIICFVSMLFFAGYLALGRRNKHVPSLWLYIVPVYLFGGIFCFLVSLFFVNPIKTYEASNILAVLGLALIPTIMGHTLLNFSMQRLRGQVVAITNVGQFVFAGVMGFFFLSEAPRPAFYIAAVLAVTGAVVVLLNRQAA